uniref:Reverse transcriptase n=1 Tax=Solanum tuberosum TaxID=4113 RepID=M1DSP2_SOLTU
MSISESLPSSSTSCKSASSSFASSSCKSLAKVNMSLTLSKTLSCKYDYLYEVDVLHLENKISSTYLPLLNPYSAFVKKSYNPWMQIRSLVQQKPKGVREYVVVLKLYQHPILANQEEQFITLQMPEDFPRQWKSLGFTHIDFGAVIVALTYYGRKGQPVVARISLLDTSFYEYQHENLGTSEITLNAGTVFVTVFPNFNMSLQDPYLMEALKI